MTSQKCILVGTRWIAAKGGWAVLWGQVLVEQYDKEV